VLLECENLCGAVNCEEVRVTEMNEWKRVRKFEVFILGSEGEKMGLVRVRTVTN